MCLETKEAAGFALETGHGFSHYSGGSASQGCAEVRVFNPADPFAISLSVAATPVTHVGFGPKKHTHIQQAMSTSWLLLRQQRGEQSASRWDVAVTDHSSTSVRSHAPPPRPPLRHTADGRHACNGSTT